jgi:hypothetical protein
VGTAAARDGLRYRGVHRRYRLAGAQSASAMTACGFLRNTAGPWFAMKGRGLPGRASAVPGPCYRAALPSSQVTILSVEMTGDTGPASFAAGSVS